MKKQIRRTEPEQAPRFVPPQSSEYIKLQRNPREAFKLFQAVDYERPAKRVNLGAQAWPPQESLERHITFIMALNLFRSCMMLPREDRPRAWEAMGLWDRKHVPTHVRGMEKIADAGPREMLAKLEAVLGTECGLTVDPVRSLEGKARRVGTSAWLLAHNLQQAAFRPDIEVAVVAHDEKAVQNIFRTLKGYYELWPPEHWAMRPAELAKSRTLLEFNNGSKLATYTASGSEIRSFQLNIVHLSEYAHYTDMTAVAPMLTALPPHCWVWKESTANGPQGPFYEDWIKAHTPHEVALAWDQEDYAFFSQWNGLYKWFFSWLDDPRYQEVVFDWERQNILDTLSEYESALMARYPKRFTLERVKWRRNKIRSGECNDETLPPEQFFMQEYPADEDEMFQGTGDMPFPADKLDAMEQRAKTNPPIAHLWLSATEAPKIASPAAANCQIWEAPEPGARYVLGCDGAEGLGKNSDASYIPIFRRIDGTRRVQVAAFWSKRMRAKEVGHVLTLLAEWYNDCWCNPEGTNSPGQAICTTVYEDNRYPHVFRRDNPTRVSGAEQHSWYLGYDTTSRAKKALIIEELIWAVRNNHVEIRDPAALQEMRIFTRVDGKYGAPPGRNDDRVVGIALANYADSVYRGAPSLPGLGGSQRKTPGVREEEANRKRLEGELAPPEPRDPYTLDLLEKIAKMRKKAEDSRGKRAWWLS